MNIRLLVKYIIMFLFRSIYYLKIIIRSYYFRLIFKSYGKGTLIIGNIKVIKPWNISIGKNSTINEGVLINAENDILIGNNVHISSYVIINSGYLDISSFPKMIHKGKSVIIGDNVWLASGSIINPGVTIGKNSVVGAGSVVTKNVKPNILSLGIPSKPTKII